jgi:RHS repeat-associated protein
MQIQIRSEFQSRSSGKERDSETGLDYFGARYYGSNMGRWMSPDWAGSPEPVPYAEFTDPQTLNLYGYTRNNPLSHVDADGHCPQCLGALFGAAAGAVSILYQTGKVVVTGKGEIPTNRQIAGAIIGGAIGGAIGTGGGGGILTNVISKGGMQVAKATVTQAASQAAVGGVVGGVANRAVATGDVNKTLDPKAMAVDATASFAGRVVSANVTANSELSQNTSYLNNQYASPGATGAQATTNLAVGDTARSMSNQVAQQSTANGALIKTGSAAAKQAVKKEDQ